MAASQPGLYQKMLRNFQNAKAAATLNDFPTFENRNILSCTVVYSDDQYATAVGYMFQLRQVLPGGGPQIPSQTIIKPIFAVVYSDASSDQESTLTSALINSVSFSAQADGLHINIAQNENSGGSPAAWIVRKSDYIYFSQVTAGQNIPRIGDCYPTSRK